jgi:ABC-type multidrug transport system fused ATPase/permease subunit
VLTLVAVWAVVAISLMLLSRGFSAGLPLAYFLGLSLIHVPGAALDLDEELEWTRIGFEQTVIGMVAFLIAVMIARYVAFRRSQHQGASLWRPPDFATESVAAMDRLALYYCIIGGVAYFVVLPFASLVASATAIVSSLGSLMVVGLCLRLWLARECRNWSKFWSTIALLPLLPLATLVQGGFLGFGIYWVLATVCFMFAQSKRRIGYFLLTPIVLFVGISVFVNYMAARTDIREVVWDEQSTIADRIQRVEYVFRNFEWLDTSNWAHRRAIEDRLNQNWLIGAAVENLETGVVAYASGATVGNVIIGLIPRAVWPDKPAVGGGRDVVSEFTGIEFAEGTSVGAGQTFEFYINFGTIGVIGGFLFLGLIIGWMDVRVIEHLHRADRRGFLIGLLICLALLQPGGNLLEIVASAASSAITAYGLVYFFGWRLPAAGVGDRLMSLRSPRAEGR